MTKRPATGWSGGSLLLSFVIGFVIVAAWRR